MYAIEIIFKEGPPARFMNVKSFYYDEAARCFILKDKSGTAFLPRENTRIIIKKEPKDAN